MPVGICNLVLAIVVAVIIVLAMNLVGSLLISALVVFPALSAMRLCRSFLGVTICAAVLSVLCALAGMLIAIVAGTPVGSTIVMVDLIAFLLSVSGSGFVKILSRKKISSLVLLCSVASLLVGCGGQKEKAIVHEEPKKQNVKIDLDLTQLNNMMAYTQVFYMIQKPQDYVGQVIRMSGKCTVTRNRTTQEMHFNCNITDASGMLCDYDSFLSGRQRQAPAEKR